MDDEELDIVSLGRAIRERREARGWARFRLAGKAELADPYLGRIEAGATKRLGVGVLIRVARALDVTVVDLLRDAGVPTGATERDELGRLYNDLGHIERRALLRIGGVLREVAQEYAVMQGGEEPPRYRVAESGGAAAYDRHELEAEAYRDVHAFGDEEA